MRDITLKQLSEAVTRHGFRWEGGSNNWAYLPCGCGVGLKPIFGNQANRAQLAAAIRWSDQHICNR